MNVRDYYHAELSERGYQPDEAQARAIDRLQTFYDDWVAFKGKRRVPGVQIKPADQHDLNSATRDGSK